MQSVEQTIRDFLIQQGATPFWADSCISIVREGLANNVYFPLHAIAQAAIISKGHVKRYGATIKVRCPDVERDATIRIRYTFNPNIRKAHKLWVNEL